MHKSKVDVAVLILFFNRPHLLSKVFEQVKIARPSKLYLFHLSIISEIAASNVYPIDLIEFIKISASGLFCR